MPDRSRAEDRGWAGSSAHHEYARLRRERERMLRDAPPLLRDLLADAARHSRALSAWERGAKGEAIVGRILDGVDGIRVLHDRAMPGRSANIDHIVIAPSGVYVIDAKHYTEHPRFEAPPGEPDRRRRLWVGHEDRTALVDAARWQAAVISAILGEPGIPVRGVLCFVGADWTTGNGFVVDGVGVTSDSRIAALVGSPGPLDPASIARLHELLDASLSPA